MAIKTGYTVYDHMRYNAEDITITHFGCKDVQDAIRYCRENLCRNAEIKFGKYDDTRYNMKEVGPQKTIGVFKRIKRNNTVKYVFIVGKKRYPVEKDGTIILG